MSHHASRAPLLATASLLALCLPAASAFADDVPPIPAPPPSSQAVQQVISTDTKTALPDNIPAVVVDFSDKQIEESVNAITSAETLKYLPDLEVRERYIGDRNGLIATRTTGTTSGAESLVYADDLLLSNLLGNSYSYPPRWGMVSVPEIKAIDFVYGPFSAIYPGNSMGGVLTMTTKMPDHPTAYADAKTFVEDFKLYGTEEYNPGFDGSAGFGNKVGNLSYWVDADHLDAHGHPMSFATVSTGGGDGFGTSSGTTTAPTGCGTIKICAPIGSLTGYKVDTDSYGNTRYVFGAYSIDHTIQDQGKLKLAYDITPDIRATYTLGLWGNTSNESWQSYTSNTATGQTFTNGYVQTGGKWYSVSSMGPETIQELHMMNAVSLKSDTHGRFDWSLAYSDYSYLQDDTRIASTSLAGTGLAGSLGGTNQKMAGTGWETVEARGILRLKDLWDGKHEVTAGYHQDGYKLSSYTYANTDSWQKDDGTLSASSLGGTQTQAGYVQDAYQFLPDWTLTLGGREEFWSATNGANYAASTGWIDYPNRTAVNFSPKAALAYQVTPDWAERVSFGKAYRYPTVTELFQTGLNATNAPDLAPEEAWSYDWTSEYTYRRNTARLSLFEEFRQNAIVSQTNYQVTPNVSGYQNVAKVRMRGVEVADGVKDAGIDGLDLSGSVTYTQSTITSDPEYTLANGAPFPRIPMWRAKLLGVYHVNEKLSTSVGMRYSGKDYTSLNAADTNGGVYGGISAYFVVDSRVTYKVADGVMLAAGVDNASDAHYFVSPHPYPQITGFTEVKFSY